MATIDKTDPNFIRERPVLTVLKQHQVQSRGMTSGTPDRCICGREVMPEPSTGEFNEDILDRRHRAFAKHQEDMLVLEQAIH